MNYYVSLREYVKDVDGQQITTVYAIVDDVDMSSEFVSSVGFETEEEAENYAYFINNGAYPLTEEEERARIDKIDKEGNDDVALFIVMTIVIMAVYIFGNLSKYY